MYKIKIATFNLIDLYIQILFFKILHIYHMVERAQKVKKLEIEKNLKFDELTL